MSIVRELTLADLARGTRVTWEWSPVSTALANEKTVRPLGRVVTREDLPLMGIELGIQADDDISWVLDPAQMIAKGKKIFRSPGCCRIAEEKSKS